MLGCIALGLVSGAVQAFGIHGPAWRAFVLAHANADLAVGILIGMAGMAVGMGILLWEALE